MENKKKHSKKKSNKKNKKIPIILSIFILLALVAAALGGYTFTQLNKMNTADLSKSNEDLGIDSEIENLINSQDPKTML